MIGSSNTPFIQVNSQRITSPYIIKAIGDKSYLESAVNIKSSMVQVLKEEGHGVEIQTSGNNKQIVIKDYKKIKLYEEDVISFNKYDEFDLVVAFRPCFPTETIINKCIENNINFIIYLCPCIHQGINSSFKFKTYDQWIKYLKKKLLQLTNYKIKFIIDKNMPDECPIIIGIKK